MKGEEAGFTLAVTVWQGRISPVFDAARRLLIARVEDTGIVGRQYCHFSPGRLSQLVELLSARGVNTVICGAISEESVRGLEAAGFELFSFVAGDCREVLEAFIHGKPEWVDLRMPGCGKNVCCRGRIRRGREISPDHAGPPSKADKCCTKGNKVGGKRFHR